MAIGTIPPVPVQQFFDANGNPLAGGKLYFYEAGTSTPSPAYANVELTIVLANPVILDAGGYAPPLYLAALSYKVVLTDALNVTVWTVDNITTVAALRTGTSIVSLTGLQHDVAVPPGIISFIELRNSSLLTIDGFSGGTPGQILVLRALGTGQVNLVNISNSTSTETSKMIHFVSSGPTSLVGVVGGSGGAGTAVYIRGANYWLLTSHEQGGWIRVPYVAANYHTDTAAVWTVESGDVLQHDYYLRGNLLLVTVALFSGTITGSPLPVHLYAGGFPYIWRTGVSYLPATVVEGGNIPTTSTLSAAPNMNWVDAVKVGFVAYALGNASVFCQGTIDVV